MWHRIAALLGATVDELRARMSSAEFVDWCAFYSLEPWGYEAATWRMGVLGATVANYSGLSKKSVKPSDFFPAPAGKRKRKMADPELHARMKADIEKANGR
jgi:hypothetical protein